MAIAIPLSVRFGVAHGNGSGREKHIATRGPSQPPESSGTLMPSTNFKAVIVGAGPAGLTAAYELSKQRAPVVVLEGDPEYVGGISRTVKYKGFHFDIGGHRFFSKS